MGADEFTQVIYKRREVLMALGHNDTECARLIAKELNARRVSGALITDKQITERRIQRRIVTHVARGKIDRNPNNVKRSPSIKKKDGINRKRRRSYLIKEGLTDSEIALRIAAEESRNGRVVKPATVRTWISKAIAQGRLTPNPRRSYARYNLDYIKSERARLIAERLSDTAICLFIERNNRANGWNASRISDIIVAKVNSRVNPWPKNLNNPQFGDFDAASQMRERYKEFLKRFDARVIVNGAKVIVRRATISA